MRRRPRSTRPSLLALSLGLLTTTPLPLGAQAAAIAGLWRYSAEASETVDDARPQGAPGGGFPGGSGGPRGGMGGGPRSRGGIGSPESSALLMGFLRPVLQILIRQDDSTVTVSDASGQMQTVRTDGRKVKEYSLSGEAIETTARWKESRLSIERKFSNAGSVKESYYIDPITQRLVIEVRVSGAAFPRAIEMRRVYDLAKGS